MKSATCIVIGSISALACMPASAKNTSIVATNSGSENENAVQILSFESDQSGFNTNNFVVVSGKEAALIDTQFTPGLAKKALDSFSLSKGVTLKYAIATHPNPDKFNGATFAQEKGAKFVTSKETANAMSGVHEYKKNFFVNVAKMFQEKDYPIQPKVDVTFNKTKTLNIGNIKIELTELAKSGVSSNQTVAYIPSAKALFVGDLVHFNTHAWLEGGIVSGKASPTIPSWIEALTLLKSKYPKDTIVYGGRGKPVPIVQAVDAQIDYLKKADELVQNYVQALGSKKTELSSAASASHFEKMTQLFQKEWPNFQFPYLIQYGVYGLAQSK